MLVKIGSLQRRRGRKVRSIEIHGVIVATKRKLPLVSNARSASRTDKISPTNPSLNGPTLVAIRPLVQGSIDLHSRLQVECKVILESVKATGATLRKVDVELSVVGIELEFIVT